MERSHETQAKPETEIITVRIHSPLLSELRLVCQALGVKMSNEIRIGMQMRYDQLIADPEVQQAVAARLETMKSMYETLWPDQAEQT